MPTSEANFVDMYETPDIAKAINKLCKDAAHPSSDLMVWDVSTENDLDSAPLKVALMHSALSKVLEEAIKDSKDGSVERALANIIIMACGFSAEEDLDLGKAVTSALNK